MEVHVFSLAQESISKPGPLTSKEPLINSSLRRLQEKVRPQSGRETGLGHAGGRVTQEQLPRNKVTKQSLSH